MEGIGSKMLVLIFIVIFGLLILIYMWFKRFTKLFQPVEVQPWEYPEWFPFY